MNIPYDPDPRRRYRGVLGLGDLNSILVCLI